MSTIYGNWKKEDIRAVIQSLDDKTGMHGASLSICLLERIDDGKTLGAYCHSKGGDMRMNYFQFSRHHFNDSEFRDLAVIDVIRHEYCHYVVDCLGLGAVFDDDDPHGKAWKTVCGLLNTDQDGKYCKWHFYNTTEDRGLRMTMSEDIMPVDFMEQIERWGCNLPSLHRRRFLEKKLFGKYTRARVFSAGDMVIHNYYGQGVVLDTLPMENKQMLYVRFDDGTCRIVQNRQVYKIVNGQVKKPATKAS